MSIAKLARAKQEERPALVFDLEPWIAEPGILRFREPKAADLFVKPDAERELQIEFAEFPPDLIRQVYVLGRCYIPDGSEGQSYSAMRSFGQLARDNKGLFLTLIGAFADAFPINNVPALKAQSKNDSTA